MIELKVHQVNHSTTHFFELLRLPGGAISKRLTFTKEKQMREADFAQQEEAQHDCVGKQRTTPRLPPSRLAARIALLLLLLLLLRSSVCSLLARTVYNCSVFVFVHAKR